MTKEGETITFFWIHLLAIGLSSGWIHAPEYHHNLYPPYRSLNWRFTPFSPHLPTLAWLQRNLTRDRVRSNSKAAIALASREQIITLSNLFFCIIQQICWQDSSISVLSIEHEASHPQEKTKKAAMSPQSWSIIVPKSTNVSLTPWSFFQAGTSEGLHNVHQLILVTKARKTLAWWNFITFSRQIELLLQSNLLPTPASASARSIISSVRILLLAGSGLWAWANKYCYEKSASTGSLPS